MPRRLLLVSSSRCHPHGYLDHCEREVCRLFEGLEEILFIPFARPSGQTHDEYTAVARERFATMNLNLRGIHEFPDPRSAVESAQGIFTGGGNTFVLLRDLYELRLVDPLRERIVSGLPYLGTSAGSNIAGLTIGTSNDMPIVFPPSFEAIGAVPFNLNPHYPIAPPDPTHKGETRDDRLHEFHRFNDQLVVALHEDGMLQIEGDSIELIGERNALLFRPGRELQPLSPGSVSPDLLPR